MEGKVEAWELVSKYGAIVVVLASEAAFLISEKPAVQASSVATFALAASTFVSFEIRQNRSRVSDFDKWLFSKFLRNLPAVSMKTIEEQHFGDPVEEESIKPLRVFVSEWGNAQHEFLDKKVEKEKGEFLKSSEDFLHALAKRSCSDGSGLIRVVPKGTHEHEVFRYEDEIQVLNRKADEVHKAYEEFIRVGRKRILN